MLCAMNELLPVLRTLGERVRWARKRLGLTQKELAAATHMDQTSISAIERDGVENPRNLGQLAQTLHVPHAWLRFGITDLESFTDVQVQAMAALGKLSADDQQTVLSLIQRLSDR